MAKKYKVDQELIADVKEDTAAIEKKYRQQQKQKRKKRAEKEELSQKWLGPILLITTLLAGYLVSLIYN
jgi:hypothetical protein